MVASSHVRASILDQRCRLLATARRHPAVAALALAVCAPASADSTWTLRAALEIGAERELERHQLGIAPGEHGLYEVAARGGGYLAVWSDGRTAFGAAPAPLPRVHAARLDESGTVLDATGFPVMPQEEVWASIHAVMAACADDDRCVVVAEREQRDVIAVRVFAGEVLDAEPLALAAGPTWPHDVAVAWDGDAFRVAWAASDGIFSSRLGVDGQLEPPVQLAAESAGEMLITTRVACQRPRCLVTWSDMLTGGETGVHGRLVDRSGVIGSAFVVNDEGGRQWWADSVWDGERYWVGFLDEPDPYRTGHGITVVRITDDGTVLDPAGIEVAPPDGERDPPTLGHDGTHLLVLWAATDSFTRSIFANRVTSDGAVVDPVERELGAQHTGALDGVQIACRAGACFAGWSQRWYFRGRVRGSRLAGLTEIDTAGIDISTSPPGQADAAATYGNGRYFVAWQDSRTSPHDTRVATIRGALFAPDMLDLVPVVLDPFPSPDPGAPCPEQSLPAVAASSHSYLVAWHDACAYYDDVIAQVVSPDGTTMSPPFAVDTAPLAQTRPATASSGASFLVVWEHQHRSPAPRSIEGRRFDAGGAAMEPGPVTISSNGTAPAVAFDGERYVVVWRRAEASGTSRTDLFAARVSPDGVVLDPPEIGIAQVAARAEDAQSVACGGGVCLVVWRAGATAVLGARIGSDGSVLDPGGFHIASVTTVVTDTSVAYDGSTFTVAWRTGTGELRGATVTPEGGVPAPGDISIAPLSLGLVRPIVVSNGTSHALAVYDRFDASTEYRARRVRARTLLPLAEPVDAGISDATPTADGAALDGAQPPDAGTPDAMPDAGADDAAVPDAMPPSADASAEPPEPDGTGCGCRAAAGGGGELLLVAAGILVACRRRHPRAARDGSGQRLTRRRAHRRLVVAAVLVAACSDPGGVPLDAPADAPPDVAVPADAAGGDAGASGVLVRILDGEQPVAGVAVLFHDETGRMIGRGVTAADGELRSDVPDGSMVTVVKRSAPVWLRTIRGAERGDELVFGQQHRSVVDGWITMVVPPPPPPPPAQPVFTVSTHCAGAETLPGGALVLPLTRWCAPAQRASVMAVLGQVPPGQPYSALAYFEERDVPLVPGATMTLAGPWAPALTQQVAVSGIPVGAMIHVSKTWYREGLPFHATGHRLSPPGSFAVPGGGDAWRASVSVCSTASFGCQYWYQRLTDPLIIAGDFDAARLPWITSTAVDLGLRTQLTWTTDRVVPHTGAKVRVLQLDGDRLLAEWTTVLPAATSSTATATMPELPADLVDLWVDLGALAPVTTAVVELDRTVAGSYADLRQAVFYAEAVPGFSVPQSELSGVSVSADVWWDQVPVGWP